MFHRVLRFLEPKENLDRKIKSRMYVVTACTADKFNSIYLLQIIFQTNKKSKEISSKY